MKPVFSTLLLLCFCFSIESKAQVNWMTIEEAFAKSQETPKKIFIDVYTDWCGWCKVMDKNTFSHPEVASYLNTHFYPVKLNAEGKAPIKLGEQTFEFNAQQGTHQIAIALLQGKLSYPTVVYLDEKFQMIQPLPGYMDAPTFHPIVTFIGEDHYKREPFDQYKAQTYPSLFQELKKKSSLK